MSKRPASPPNSAVKVRRIWNALLPEEKKEIVRLHEQGEKTRTKAHLLDQPVGPFYQFFKKIKEEDEAETTVAPHTVMEMSMTNAATRYSTSAAAASADAAGTHAEGRQQQLSNEELIWPVENTLNTAVSEPHESKKNKEQRKILTVEDIGEIVRQAEDGRPANEIAMNFGCSQQAIYYHIKKEKAKQMRKMMIPAAKDTMFARHTPASGAGARCCPCAAAASVDVPGKRAEGRQQQLSDRVFNQPSRMTAAEAAQKPEPQQQSRKQIMRELQQVKQLLVKAYKTISSAESKLEQL